MPKVKKPNPAPVSKANKGSKGNNASKPTNTSVNRDTPNFFVQRGDGKPIVVDQYKDIKGAKVLNNNETDKATTFNTDLGKALTKGNDLLKKVQKVVGVAAKVKSAFKGGGNVLDKLAGVSGLSKDLLSGFGVQPGSPLYTVVTNGENIVVKGAQAANRVRSTDWHNADSIAKLINHFSGNNELFKIKDLGAQAGFVASVVNEATKNGFPNSFAEVTKLLENDVVRRAVNDILPVSISMSDLKNIKSIVDTMGSAEMKSLFPGLVEEVNKNWNKQWLSDDASKDSDDKYYSDIKSTYKAYDEKWYLTDRKNEEILSVEKLLGASDNFTETFTNGLSNDSTATKDEKLLLLAKHFSPTTVLADLQKRFPKTVIKTNTFNVDTQGSVFG